MREQINLITKSSTQTATGSYEDASSTTIATVWAEVHKGDSDQDVTLDISNLESDYTFVIRRPTEGDIYSKANFVVWNGDEYQINAISLQRGYKNFVMIKTSRTQ